MPIGAASVLLREHGQIIQDNEGAAPALHTTRRRHTLAAGFSFVHRVVGAGRQTARVFSGYRRRAPSACPDSL